MSKDFFTLADVRKRGWSARLIASLLGQPDMTKRNPRARGWGNSKYPPVQLYKIERVVAAEKSEEFLAYQSRCKKQGSSALSRAALKRDKLIQWAWELVIEVPDMKWKLLVEEACCSYNAVQERDDFDPATTSSDPDFINRIVVNYLRHECSKYDRLLSDIFGKVGTQEARDIIRSKVYEAISDTYPELEDECERQKLRRLMADEE